MLYSSSSSIISIIYYNSLIGLPPFQSLSVHLSRFLTRSVTKSKLYPFNSHYHSIRQIKYSKKIATVDNFPGTCCIRCLIYTHTSVPLFFCCSYLSLTTYIQCTFECFWVLIDLIQQWRISYNSVVPSGTFRFNVLDRSVLRFGFGSSYDLIRTRTRELISRR